MTDDMEGRLRRDLPATQLPAAPDSLHVKLQAVAAGEPPRVAGREGGRTGRIRLLLGIAAVVILGGAVAISYINSQPTDGSDDGRWTPGDDRERGDRGA